MRDNLAEMPFLQKALVSSSGIGRKVHSFMLSIQHFFCRPRCREECFGEAVVGCDMPEPCRFPSLYSFKGRKEEEKEGRDEEMERRKGRNRSTLVFEQQHSCSHLRNDMTNITDMTNIMKVLTCHSNIDRLHVRHDEPLQVEVHVYRVTAAVLRSYTQQTDSCIRDVLQALIGRSFGEKVAVDFCRKNYFCRAYKKN